MNELKLIEDLLIELGHNVSKETINGFNIISNDKLCRSLG